MLQGLIVLSFAYWVVLRAFLSSAHLLIFFEKFFQVYLVGFVALRPKSTAMVIAGRSVHLTTLFPGQA